MTNKENKALCERFPFLIPCNMEGLRITEASGGGYWPRNPDAVPVYNYEYTVLDSMPLGWARAFGEQLCEELREELEKAGCLDSYMVDQIKEKYGRLCWYDSGNTPHGYEIIEKYADLSERTCICCGRKATRITTGWISPYCDECVPRGLKSVPVEDWFGTRELVSKCRT